MDIKPLHLEIVKNILANHLPIGSTVWLFGSRVIKAKKKYSDLDLAVDCQHVLPLSVMTLLQYDFSESDLPYKVDIVDLRNMDDSFRDAIRPDMVMLFQKSG